MTMESIISIIVLGLIIVSALIVGYGYWNHSHHHSKPPSADAQFVQALVDIAKASAVLATSGRVLLKFTPTEDDKGIRLIITVRKDTELVVPDGGDITFDFETHDFTDDQLHIERRSPQ